MSDVKLGLREIKLGGIQGPMELEGCYTRGSSPQGQ